MENVDWENADSDNWAAPFAQGIRTWIPYVSKTRFYKSRIVFDEIVFFSIRVVLNGPITKRSIFSCISNCILDIYLQ